MDKCCIVVHGGASAFPGDWETKKDIWKASILKIAETGHKVLIENGSALDAVEAAVRALESDPLYNAGTGCVLTSEGTVELDSMLMDGYNSRAGAVCCVDFTDHPVSMARLVMEKSPHVMIARDGARNLAKKNGYPILDDFRVLITEETRRTMEDLGDYETALKKEMNVSKPSLRSCDTVGAIALDRQGRLACATSTGGIAGKLPGRIGDTPIIGCGGFADRYGASVATGHGEALIKGLCCGRIVRYIEDGLHPLEAGSKVLDKIFKDTNSCGGIIALDAAGQIGVYNTAEFMPWASMDGTGKTQSFFQNAL